MRSLVGICVVLLAAPAMAMLPLGTSSSSSATSLMHKSPTVPMMKPVSPIKPPIHRKKLEDTAFGFQREGLVDQARRPVEEQIKSQRDAAEQKSDHAWRENLPNTRREELARTAGAHLLARSERGITRPDREAPAARPNASSRRPARVIGTGATLKRVHHRRHRHLKSQSF